MIVSISTALPILSVTEHNHGEGIEQYWALINALGAQIRQMNNRYQQDTLIIHHGDHNWKKTYTQGGISFHSHY